MMKNFIRRTGHIVSVWAFHVDRGLISLVDLAPIVFCPVFVLVSKCYALLAMVFGEQKLASGDAISISSWLFIVIERIYRRPMFSCMRAVLIALPVNPVPNCNASAGIGRRQLAALA